MLTNFFRVSAVAAAILASSAEARVYKNIPVAKFKASYSLNDFKGMTFLAFMQTEIFPALNAQAERPSAEEHIDAVQKGQGVEVRLTEDVSTYHVKYKAYGERNAERSGRSFAGVGTGSRIPYVADASYKHYLTTLGALMQGDESEVRSFYTAVIQILSNSDASAIEELSVAGKQVIADFVAVYIAEQYRHMMSGDGDGTLGRKHNWDDAHLQVTLLAGFHGGQSIPAMFYEGTFTNAVYPQLNKVGEEEYCVYRQDDPVRKQLKKRKVNLTDYWQFNPECERSGVNMTRRDFSLLGNAITLWEAKNNPEVTQALAKVMGGSSKNGIADVAGLFVSNDAPAKFSARESKALTAAIVNFIMQSRTDADAITKALARSR